MRPGPGNQNYFRVGDYTLTNLGKYYSQAECGPKVDSAVSKHV